MSTPEADSVLGGKNIVLLSDGTGNEPKLSGESNILRLYKMLVQDPQQLVWYDPGVGTEGDPRAITRIGRAVTKFAGQVVGYGLKDNVMDGYRVLMENYQLGDRIYLFGFSRGAFTSRAIAGLLYQVGLLRPGQENLIPYALRLFWWHQGYERKEEWTAEADEFSAKFARPDFGRRSEDKIHYLGIWDTVKATGFARANLILPWTAQLPNVRILRHAVSIDERRRPYKPLLLKYSLDAKHEGRFKEVWFAGVHSDIGGTFQDNQLGRHNDGVGGARRHRTGPSAKGRSFRALPQPAPKSRLRQDPRYGEVSGPSPRSAITARSGWTEQWCMKALGRGWKNVLLRDGLTQRVCRLTLYGNRGAINHRRRPNPFRVRDASAETISSESTS